MRRCFRSRWEAPSTRPTPRSRSSSLGTASRTTRGRRSSLRRRRARPLLRLPEGRRHGELNRHEALREATGDRLLPVRRRPAPARHVRRWLVCSRTPTSRTPPRRGSPSTARSSSSRGTSPGPSSSRSGSAARVDRAHRHRAHARRRTAGCRTDGGRLRPEGHTDHYMWRQWLEHARVPRRDERSATYLTFPIRGGDSSRRRTSAALEDWFRRRASPASRRSSTSCSRRRSGALPRTTTCGRAPSSSPCRRCVATRSWRLRERLVSASPLRALLARRRGGR